MVTLSEVHWLGRTIAVKNEKVRAFLLAEQDMQSTESPKVSQLEKLIFEARDCLQLLRESNLEKGVLYLYLAYLRLQLTCRRNLQLIKSLKNSSEFIRPYETIIGCLGEINLLPLEQHFHESNIEEFKEEINRQIILYKALRCYYIGQVARNNWKESIALFQKASHYCDLALQKENISQVFIFVKFSIRKLKYVTFSFRKRRWS